MVTTRRQSHGESSEQLQYPSPELSGKKRGRVSQTDATTRKRTRLVQNPQASNSDTEDKHGDVFMSGALPSRSVIPELDGAAEENTELVDINGAVPLQETANGGISVDTNNTEEFDDGKSTGLDDSPSIVTTAIQKPTHKRFGSEEPLDLAADIPEPKNAAPATTKIDHDDDDSSDDGAPEDVTAAVAQAQSRQAVAEATKAVEQQRSRTKRKRRERDERFKQQSLSALIKRSVAPDTTHQQPSALEKEHSVHEIPELLPDFILEDEPVMRPPTPDSEGSRPAIVATKQRSRRKMVPGDHPNDLKIGPVQARVLEKVNKHLPPKVDEKSKLLRENWLLGRRDKSSLFARRRRVGAKAGFLRG